MVYFKTRLFVSDNSGATSVECIKILGPNYKCARSGDILVVAVKRAKPNKKVRRHEVHRGVLVRRGKRTLRRNGSHISFARNSVVILDSRNGPLAKRVIGSVAHELRSKKFLKLALMASSTI